MKKEIRSILFYVSYLLCILFSMGAAMNEGLTRWYSGIPFFALFFFLTRKYQKPKKMIFLSIFIIASAISINSSLPHNTFLYPILNEGYLLVKEDGYIHQYSDNSAGFYHDEDTGIGCSGCGEIKKHLVKSGEKLSVESIAYTYPDFSFKRAYKTKYGNIVPRENFELSHEPNPLLKLGNLMYYLIIPLVVSII